VNVSNERDSDVHLDEVRTREEKEKKEQGTEVERNDQNRRLRNQTESHKIYLTLRACLRDSLGFTKNYSFVDYAREALSRESYYQ